MEFHPACILSQIPNVACTHYSVGILIKDKLVNAAALYRLVQNCPRPTVHRDQTILASLTLDHDKALTMLRGYAWPGNVRELENVIERLAINVPRTGVVSGADVSLDLEVNGFAQSDEHREIVLAKRLRCLTTSGVLVRHLSKRQELNLYVQELAKVGGDVTKAARRLGIKRTTLHMRIKRLEARLASPTVEQH